MKRVYFAFGLVLSIALLAGCGTSGLAEPTTSTTQAPPAAVLATETVAVTTPDDATPTGETAPVETNQPSETSGASGAESPAAETAPAEPAAIEALAPQDDTQGAVEVTVIPMFGAGPSSTLDFKITLNTHSVDLAFDLSKLAELKTDTGVTLLPVKWDAPSGGHHVEGVLFFPAEVDGQPALAGVSQIILTIKEVDAPPLRTFTWDLAR